MIIRWQMLLVREQGFRRSEIIFGIDIIRRRISVDEKGAFFVPKLTLINNHRDGRDENGAIQDEGGTLAIVMACKTLACIVAEN